MSMINRDKFLNKIQEAFRVHRIVCLLGPYGCGKTTIAKLLQKKYPIVHWYDLRKISDMRALELPEILLYKQRGLIIIDGIQRIKALFPYLRYLHDERFDQKFLVLGDVSYPFIRQANQSLAGRIAYMEVLPLSLSETGDLEKLWTNGGFPESYLSNQEDSLDWREDYLLKQVEYNLDTAGLIYQKDTLRKLLFLLADYHGEAIIYSKLSKELKVSLPTIKKYVFYLKGSFTIRLLSSWTEDLKKLQVRSRKIYFRDSGLLNYILNLKTHKAVIDYAKIRYLFEGFAMEEVIKAHVNDNDGFFFWASHNGSRLDLLILRRSKKFGFIFTMSERPKLTPSMRISLKDLTLTSLTVIYPKGESYMLSDKIKVISLEEYVNAPQ